MEELRRLVREQRRDFEYGSYQPPQSGTVALSDVMLDDSCRSLPMRKQYVACALHGRGPMRRATHGTVYCGACQLEYKRQWRARNRYRERASERARWHRRSAEYKQAVNARRRKGGKAGE